MLHHFPQSQYFRDAKCAFLSVYVIFRNFFSCFAPNMSCWRIRCMLICSVILICGGGTRTQEAVPQSIEATLNETVTLQCNVNSPNDSDKVTIVIWYRNNDSVPIYSVDMRERNHDHRFDEKIGDRVHYNVDNRSLIIHHVKESDEGLYKCRMDFKQTPTKYSEIQLVILAPVQNVSILEAVPNTASWGNSSLMLPAITEGSSLTATCVSTGGNPKPRLTWWRNDRIIDHTSEVQHDEVRNILSLDLMQRENADDVLSCRAENSRLLAPKIVTVAVNIYLPAQDIKFVGENKAMSAGHQYEIACEARGSRPAANITWWKDTVSLRGPIRKPRKLITDDPYTVISVLTFTPAEADAGKTLSCEAHNAFVPNERRRDSWTLKVNYAPVVTIQLGSNLNVSSIREGVDVYFECNVRADPWIKKIRWLHNDKQVTNNASTGVIISNQTLVLQSVTRLTSGQYKCAASNTEGETVSAPFNLDVKYEPTCRINQQRVFGAERNEEVNITCHVDGNPSPGWFRWSFNNSMTHHKTMNPNQAWNGNGSSVIAYRPTSEAHYGTLLCSSQNELGPQVVPCAFHIVSAGRPDPPHNCTVVNLTQSWLFIKCVRGFDGGLPQEFICEVVQEWNDKVISNVTSKMLPEFRLTGLEAKTVYNVVIYATNIKGRSKEKAVLKVQTLPNVTLQSRQIVDSSTIFLKLHWAVKMTIVVIVTIALVLIVVLLAVTRFQRRKRRRKRRSLDELRKTELSQGSLSHSEDDNNPDLIPQNTITGISCPVLNSISVQTIAASDSDISVLPLWEKPVINSKVPTLLEAKRLEEFVWPTANWSTTIEPIMFVLPESIPIVPKQNAGTQTPSSPQNRKESAV